MPPGRGDPPDLGGVRDGLLRRRGEENKVPVPPHHLGGVRAQVGEAGRWAAPGVHEVDLLAAVVPHREGDPAAVARVARARRSAPHRRELPRARGLRSRAVQGSMPKGVLAYEDQVVAVQRRPAVVAVGGHRRLFSTPLPLLSLRPRLLTAQGPARCSQSPPAPSPASPQPSLHLARAPQTASSSAGTAAARGALPSRGSACTGASTG
mmetsp:Transcript_40459/g.128906  ORF Transcript_40459/g.128906 Transcript_40459/m.128906 type:complete len:208 (-) Transcript_40459:234-857(-)